MPSPHDVAPTHPVVGNDTSTKENRHRNFSLLKHLPNYKVNAETADHPAGNPKPRENPPSPRLLGQMSYAVAASRPQSPQRLSETQYIAGGDRTRAQPNETHTTRETTHQQGNVSQALEETRGPTSEQSTPTTPTNASPASTSGALMECDEEVAPRMMSGGNPPRTPRKQERGRSCYGLRDASPIRSMKTTHSNPSGRHGVASLRTIAQTYAAYDNTPIPDELPSPSPSPTPRPMGAETMRKRQRVEEDLAAMEEGRSSSVKYLDRPNLNRDRTPPSPTKRKVPPTHESCTPRETREPRRGRTLEEDHDSESDVDGYVNHDQGSDYEIDSSKMLFFYDIDPTKRRRRHMPRTIRVPGDDRHWETSDGDAPMDRSVPIEPMRQIMEPGGVPIFLHPTQKLDAQYRLTGQVAGNSSMGTIATFSAEKPK